MDLILSLFSFLATGPGILVIGLMAILMIVAWEWRINLLMLVLIQLGVAPIAVNIQGVDPQWVTVQTLVIVLCSLILALSAAQVDSSPTSRQSGNGPLRLMVVVMLYASWRLFEFDISIPLIQPQVSVLFMWLFICALLIFSLSDNPLFTGSALILWFIPIHVMIAVLFPFSNLLVLFGILELILAFCCSYLVLAERFGEEEQVQIATDITFPTTVGPRQLVDYAGNERTNLLPNDHTTMDLLAVPLPPKDGRPGQVQLPQPNSTLPPKQIPLTPPSGVSQPGMPQTGAPPAVPRSGETPRSISGSEQDSRRPVQPAERATDKPADRTGEHPLVATLSKGKRSRRPNNQEPK